MGEVSAGIVLFRRKGTALEVLLVHPGGPYCIRRDKAGWSIPKGGVLPGEEPIDAARREYGEETGFPAEGPLIPLGFVRYSGGKRVHAWAMEGDLDPARVRSIAFSLEWPPHSGQMKEFQEIDRAEWFNLEAARDKLHAGLVPLLEALRKALG
jgi:predicted NUDIX family NTP pyrophosphohydrolase